MLCRGGRTARKTLRNAARENRGENIDEYSVTRGERLPSSLLALHRVCAISESVHTRVRLYACVRARAFFAMDLRSVARERNSLPERRHARTYAHRGRVSSASLCLLLCHRRRRRRLRRSRRRGSDISFASRPYVCHVAIGREETARSRPRSYTGGESPAREILLLRKLRDSQEIPNFTFEGV